jgi:hypothetical protein
MKQRPLALPAVPLLTGHEVVLVSLATLQALPEAQRAILRRHVDGEPLGDTFALRDCDEVRRALGVGK